jgi:hypothetical protein
MRLDVFAYATLPMPIERIERLVVKASKRSMISHVLLCYIYIESAICFNLRPVQQATIQTKNYRRRLPSFSWIALSFPSSLSSIYKDRRWIRRAIEIRKSVCSGHIQEEIVAHDVLFKTSFFQVTFFRVLKLDKRSGGEIADSQVFAISYLGRHIQAAARARVLNPIIELEEFHELVLMDTTRRSVVLGQRDVAFNGNFAEARGLRCLWARKGRRKRRQRWKETRRCAWFQ